MFTPPTILKPVIWVLLSLFFSCKDSTKTSYTETVVLQETTRKNSYFNISQQHKLKDSTRKYDDNTGRFGNKLPSVYDKYLYIPTNQWPHYHIIIVY